jgi:hydroxymethylpyrimidine/phosphomethylpyrimidine kinase
VSGRVLAIGGSDSGGGAGVQADIKTITLLGGYAASAITAVTVQDTHRIHAIHPIPPDLVIAQARAVLDDIGADAIKTGMLGSNGVVEALADLLGGMGIPLVVDPVMAATTGATLLDPEAIQTLRDRLVPLASLLTPNAPEAERLTGLGIATIGDLRRAGEALLEMGAGAVLM